MSLPLDDDACSSIYLGKKFKKKKKHMLLEVIITPGNSLDLSLLRKKSIPNFIFSILSMLNIRYH